MDNFPSLAGQIALAEIPPQPEKKVGGSQLLGINVPKTQRKVCVLYGRDPVTGNRVCLKWIDSVES